MTHKQKVIKYVKFALAWIGVSVLLAMFYDDSIGVWHYFGAIGMLPTFLYIKEKIFN